MFYKVKYTIGESVKIKEDEGKLLGADIDYQSTSNYVKLSC